MKNKWLKWIIGLGGISTFTLFLQTIDANDETAQSNDEFLLSEATSLLNKENTLSENKEEREKQLLALDWDEGNWDVEYSNEAIIAIPKSDQIPFLERAEQRTRRS